MPDIAKAMLAIGEDNRIDRTEMETLRQVQASAKALVGAFFSVLILSGEKENATRRAPSGVQMKDEM